MTAAVRSLKLAASKGLMSISWRNNGAAVDIAAVAKKRPSCWDDMIRRFKLTTAFYWFGLIGLMLVTLACQCSTEPRQPVNEIKSLLADLVLAAETRSVDAVSAHLKDSFRGDGRYLAGDRNQLRRGLQLIFLRRSQIYVLPHIRRIDVNDLQTAATLKVWVLVTGARISLETLDLDVRGDVLQVTADLEYDGVWRVSSARWKRIPVARMIAEKLVD
jgi:hypothetical protein